MTLIPEEFAAPADIRHWCGTGTRHTPHVGCNGFGYDAGPPDALCPRDDAHQAHISCDGRGRTP